MANEIFYTYLGVEICEFTNCAGRRIFVVGSSPQDFSSLADAQAYIDGGCDEDE